MEENKTYDLLIKMYSEFDKRFDTVDKRFDTIDKRFDAIDKRFDATDVRLDNIEGRLSKLELKVEGEITEKIRALFDDRKVIHEKLDNIQIDINNLTAKTLTHDNKIIELSRKIK
ncbi:MAG: hypothetical protein GX892_10170 [Thermoanaerobacteraceae bacterium]|jgi:chromosome segregation ATPase|nr:hypothetical protein [Thermoanaerobacteraceae bacterium]